MNDFATKIGITTDHIWQVAVRQAVIDSWTQTVQLILAFTLLILFIVSVCLIVKFQDQLGDDKASILGVSSLLGAIGTTIFLGFYVPPTLNSIVTGFVNPESKALDKLVSQIKEVK